MSFDRFEKIGRKIDNIILKVYFTYIRIKMEHYRKYKNKTRLIEKEYNIPARIIGIDPMYWYWETNVSYIISYKNHRDVVTQERLERDFEIL